MVSRLHGGHLDRAYPLWRIYLIEGLEDGRIAVYLKIHHAVVDGVAGIRLLVKCMATNVEDSLRLPAFWEVETMKSDNAQPLPVPTPAVGGIAALRSLTREGVKSVMPVLRELRRSIDDYRAGNPNLVIGGQAPRCLFNEPVTGTRRFAAQSYSTSRIKAVAKAHEATSNDVILAMCGGALRRYLAEVDTLPDAPLIAGVPVSVRRRGSHAAGNEIAFTLTHLATNLDDPVERLVAIKNCMEYNKERMQEAVSRPADGLRGHHDDAWRTEQLAGTQPATRPSATWSSRTCLDRDRICTGRAPRLSGLYPLSLIIDGGALNITVISRRDAGRLRIDRLSQDRSAHAALLALSRGRTGGTRSKLEAAATQHRQGCDSQEDQTPPEKCKSRCLKRSSGNMADRTAAPEKQKASAVISCRRFAFGGQERALNRSSCPARPQAR